MINTLLFLITFCIAMLSTLSAIGFYFIKSEFIIHNFFSSISEFSSIFIIIVFIFYLILAIKKIKQEIKNRQDKVYQQAILCKQKQEDNIKIITSHAQEYQTETLAFLEQIYTDLKEERLDEIKKILESTKSCIRANRIPIYCDHMLINSILQVKLENAKKANINMDYRISIDQIKPFPFPDTVISSLLFNLLDNGIESCISSNSKQANIVFYMEYKKNFLLLKMTNSKDSTKAYDRKTSKEDKRHHGFGLSIIKSIATDYNGNTSFEDKGSYFESKVLLKIPTKD